MHGREPVGNGAGTWGLLEEYLSEDPDSPAVRDDLAGMAAAAEDARAAIAGIQRLEIASTRNLGHLAPTPPSRCLLLLQRKPDQSVLGMVLYTVHVPTGLACHLEAFNKAKPMQQWPARLSYPSWPLLLLGRSRGGEALTLQPTTHQPRPWRGCRDGNGAAAGLVTCTVCKRVMLAGRFPAHVPRCRGPPKQPPPPPKAGHSNSTLIIKENLAGLQEGPSRCTNGRTARLICFRE